MMVHIHSGCKDPLGGNVRMGIEYMIQNLHSEMGGADFIKIGKGQCKTQFNPVQVLFDLIDFAPQIAAGFFNQRKNIFDCFNDRIP
jgi:hypothetical protein